MKMLDKEIKETEKKLLQQLKAKKRLLSIPDPKSASDIDINKLIEFASEEISHINENKESQKDIEHWAYELIMTLVYGDDVFDWINKNID